MIPVHIIIPTHHPAVIDNGRNFSTMKDPSGPSNGTLLSSVKMALAKLVFKYEGGLSNNTFIFAVPLQGVKENCVLRFYSD